jgi:hypothetical protein
VHCSEATGIRISFVPRATVTIAMLVPLQACP